LLSSNLPVSLTNSSNYDAALSYSTLYLKLSALFLIDNS
jgi:hypothetical protein